MPELEPQISRWEADLKEVVDGKLVSVPSLAILGGTFKPQSTKAHLAILDLCFTFLPK